MPATRHIDSVIIKQREILHFLFIVKQMVGHLKITIILAVFSLNWYK